MKFVIWGHKLFTNTFGYVNYGYHRAFEHLGYEVYWLSDNDPVPEGLEDAIFMTEGQVDRNIPLYKNATYCLHHCDTKKYIDAGVKFINYCNYVEPCDRGISMNYEGHSVEKVSDFCFYDKENKAIYQPWATDLLPHEMEDVEPIMYNESLPNVNYIGTFYEDQPQKLAQFSQSVRKAGKHLNIKTNVSFEENKKLIEDSYVCLDIRAEWHKKCGYVPCRIFKGLSYGKPMGTNSRLIKKVLGDHVIFDENPSTIFDTIECEYKNMTKEKIQETINYIKDKHTYLTRAKNLINVIEENI